VEGIMKKDASGAKVIDLNKEVKERDAGLRKKRTLPNAVSLDDFHAYMPQHSYIFAPTREMWPASSVNKRLPPVELKAGKKKKIVRPTDWLDKHQPVEQMTWVPGEPTLIRDRLISHGGWIDRPGCTTFNLYRAPTIAHGDPAKAKRWLDHVRHVYPSDADHIIWWLAHRVQRPGDKINHALVLGGEPGIGKDTILQPVKHAVGHWNFEDIVPGQLLGRFNSFVKSVVLRINEGRDLGEWDRYALYEHMKLYTAAPPDVIRCDEKNIREHQVPNVCGVIITTNHKSDGLFLPANDRRHYVAWSNLTKEAFEERYWREIWVWYAQGGYGHVAAYLSTLDISSFDAKAPPLKTRAFWAIVDAGRPPEDGELADALDTLQKRHALEDWPLAVTLADVISCTEGSFNTWLSERKNSRQIPHRMETAGYVAVRNPADKTEGRWKIGPKRMVIYAKATLTVRDQVVAAANLVEGRRT
jgi:hypothetical protein